ncbi:ABC transporter permease [Trebonia kvetii]|jgi:spermidine/putrescine transport system permease protein|uniref:ABC transporter permease n=1 Tax=Trebonia kvetii TaxID=2480626 RepID=A0A6P2C8Y5_9ACTN|nr:ABC transporter permease [Trebonia kvetii]TVZ06816.1 ABC transporter permease [Trebonia kvetii]
MSAATLERTSHRKPSKKVRQRRKTGERLLHWFTWILIVWLALPIAVVIAFSFNNPHGRYNYSWTGFTFKYWGSKLFAIPDLTTAMEHSIEVAAVATIGATVLGTLVGLAVGKYKFRGQGASNLVQFACISAPEVVLGSSLATFFLQAHIKEGALTVMAAHIMFCMSFVAITVRARVVGLDPSVEDAAKDLGAGPWDTFRLVTLPMILPGVIAGAMLAFALSIDDFITTEFTSGSFVTYPLWIWSVSRQGLPPQVNVMGSIVFAVGVLFAIANSVVSRRRAA